jgi:hypothetical protein
VDNSNDPWGDAGDRTEESQVATSLTASPEASLDFSPTPLVFPTASTTSGSRKRGAVASLSCCKVAAAEVPGGGQSMRR